MLMPPLQKESKTRLKRTEKSTEPHFADNLLAKTQIFTVLQWAVRLQTILCLCALLLGASKTPVDPLVEESLTDKSIISEKKINIPGYPKAYNPSLLPYSDGYLLSFRVRSSLPSNSSLEKHYRINASYIGIARLDSHFEVIEKSVQLLPVVSHAPKPSCSAEDARLFSWGDKLFILFNDIPLPKMQHHSFALYIGELVRKHGFFYLKAPAKMLRYEHATPIEKNWSPFVAHDKLFVIYSDSPRTILEVNPETGLCIEAVKTETCLPWPWGAIRGGTPASPLRDHFITFFHTRRSLAPSAADKKGTRANYLMGAYLFSPDPPFAISHITPSPLGKIENYLHDNIRKVVFPGGLAIQNNVAHVAWGKNDKQIYITTFDLDKLLNTMQPCSTPK